MATAAKKTEPTMWKWQGTNKTGARVEGEMAGVSLALVKAELRRQGVVPLKIKKQTKGMFGPKKEKIKTKDITVFARQLATMIAAGIPLAQSFDIVARGSENASMRELIDGIKVDIESGNSLSDSFAKNPKYFNDLFINLVYAGEQSGSLEAILNRLAMYLEKTETIKKKIKKALTYPIIVLSIALIVSTGLLIFVIPQFQAVFSGFGAELPALTKYVVKASEFVQKYWWVVFAGIAGFVFTLIHLLKTSKTFQFNFDKFMLRFPIIGQILIKAVIARYARTLSTTFAAGMPLVEALSSVAGACGNRIYAKAILGVADQVSSGTQLNLAMKDTMLFPAMVIQMVAIGEESGALEAMLSKVADYYEELVDSAVDNLATLLEPIIMCILAVLIGGMVIAMYLPIFQLGKVV